MAASHATGRLPRAMLLLAATACGAGPQLPRPAPVPQVVYPSTTARSVAYHPSYTRSMIRRLGPPRAQQPVTATFVGDINLGTITLEGGIPPDSGRQILAPVHQLLTGDLVVGNFESTLADSGTPEKCLRDGKVRRNCYAFVTPVFLADRLVDAGFTHLTLANNHANDLGPDGREATADALVARGIRVVGPVGRITIDTLLRSDSVTVVGLIGFTTYDHSYNLLDIGRSARVVDSIRPLVDLLLVTFHGGGEGSDARHVPDGPEFLGREPRGDLRRWARAVIDAGADAVIGHGPHVLRGMEFYRGRLISYSLGNFATYRGFNLSGPLGLTTTLTFELDPDGAFRSGFMTPLIQQLRAGPRWDPDNRAIIEVSTLSIEDFGESAAAIDGEGRISPPDLTP